MVAKALVALRKWTAPALLPFGFVHVILVWPVFTASKFIMLVGIPGTPFCAQASLVRMELPEPRLMRNE